MLIALIAKKDSDSGFGLTILEYSRIVYYSELPIPNHKVCNSAWASLKEQGGSSN